MIYVKHAIVQRSLQHSAALIGLQSEKVKCHPRCGFHHRPFQLCKNTPTTLSAPAVNWSMLSGQNLLFHLCGAKVCERKIDHPSGRLQRLRVCVSCDKDHRCTDQTSLLCIHKAEKKHRRTLLILFFFFFFF